MPYEYNENGDLVYVDKQQPIATQSLSQPSQRLFAQQFQAVDTAAVNFFDGAVGNVSRNYESFSENNPVTSNRIEGVARGTANVLEPVQLSQQALFAVTAAFKEPDDGRTLARKIGDRLGRIDLAATFDVLSSDPSFSRPTATAKEIVDLYSPNMNEDSKRIASAILDLTYDPLVATGALKAIGAGAKAGSTLDKVAKGANSFERFINPITAPDAFTGGAISKATKAAVDKLAPRVLSIELNFPNSTRTVGNLIATPTIDRSVRLQSDFGRRTFVEEQRLRGASKADIDEVFKRISDGGDILEGVPANRWFEQGISILNRIPRMERKYTTGLTPLLKDTISGEAWSVADKLGVTGFKNTGNSNNLNRVFGDLSDAGATRKPTTGTDKFYESIDKVRGVAESEATRLFDKGRITNKVEYINEAVTKFKKFTQNAAETNALIGYHSSGYEIIRDHIISKATRLSGDGDLGVEAWYKVLRNGVDNNLDYSAKVGDEFGDLTYGQLFGDFLKKDLQSNQIDGPRRALIQEDLDAGIIDQKRFEELTADTTSISRSSAFDLDPKEYFQSLSEGHLRRSYSFIADNDPRKYIAKLKAGDLFQAGAITDSMWDDLVAEGSDSVLIGSAKQYFNTVSSSGTGNKIVTKRGMVQQLEDVGASVGQVENLMGKLTAKAKGSPAFQKMIDDSFGAIENSLTRQADINNSFGTGRSFSQKRRREISDDDLVKLGELADPMYSLLDQASNLKQRLPFVKYMEFLRDEGLNNGFVRRKAKGEDLSNFTKLEGEQYGSLKNLYVHKEIIKDLNMTIADRNYRQRPDEVFMSKTLGIVTGGLLLQPRAVIANTIGGLATSAYAGANPFAVATEFGKLLSNKKLRDRTRSEAGELIDVFESDAITNLVQKDLNGKFDALNIRSVNAVEEFAGKLGGFMAKPFGEVAEGAPLGQARNAGNVVFGLEAYSFIDNTMKLANYNVAKKHFGKKGNDITDSMAMAAERARISTFDYSELPFLTKKLRDSGLMLFPGFNTFLVPRVAKAAIERPATIAVADRFDSAANNLAFDSEEGRLDFYNSLAPYQQQSAPIAIDRNDEKGTVRVLTLNNILPVDIFDGVSNSFESTARGGFHTPIMEVANAWFSEDASGEAAFTKQFGRRVFPEGAEGSERILPILKFAWNSYGATGAKKIISFDYNGNPQGLGADALNNIGTTIPTQMYDEWTKRSEVERQRRDRDRFDYLLSATVANSRTIGLDGNVRNVRAEANNARRRHQSRMGRLSEELEELQKLSEVHPQFSEDVIGKQAELQQEQAEFQQHWQRVFDINSSASQ